MKRRFAVFAVLGAAAALTVAGVAFADHPGEGGVPLGADLTGAAECNTAGTACGLGDPDGSGTVLLRLNPGQEEICFDVTTANADPFSASHIHVAPAGIAGPVVIPTGAFTGSASRCVPAERELILAVIRNPENYYFNAHNAAFPAGAVRGQLGHVAPGQ